MVAAASDLFYRQGVERTTLAELSEVAGVPVGNMYYYFKTKDEIVAAVVDAHIAAIQATTAALEARHRNPKGRLKALVAGVGQQSEPFAQYGCPFGTLCSEDVKRSGGSEPVTAKLMAVLLGWVQEQFTAMGRDDAKELAAQLVITYQGGALLASVFRDARIVRSQARRLERWIEALEVRHEPVT